MLLRISLIVAILAGIGAGVGAYLEVSNQIPALTKQSDDENSAKKTALGELATTRTTLKKTQGDLAQTQQELSDTKSERDKAVARADAQEKRASDLSDKLAKATAERDEALNQLAEYKASDLTPEQVVKLNKNLKDAQMQIAAISEEKTVLQREYLATKTKLDKLMGFEPDIKLPAGLKGQILVVDPKWDFVVLSIGGDQGALEDGEMLVSRDGKLVAKVIIRRVDKDRCIANVVPGWKLGELIEGDVVTPAHPATS